MTRNREMRGHRAAPWLRVGTRALVVAGVAGAAWLFASAAAYAADEADSGLLRMLDIDSGSDSTVDKLGTGSVLTGVTTADVAATGPASIAGLLSPLPQSEPSLSRSRSPHSQSEPSLLRSVPLLSQTDQAVAGLLPVAVTGRARAGSAIQVLTRTVEPILDGRALAGPTGLADDAVRTVQALVSPLGVPGAGTTMDLLRRVASGGDVVIRPVAGLLSPVTSVARDAVAPISRVLDPATTSVTAIPARADGAVQPRTVDDRRGQDGVAGEVRSGPAMTLAANPAGPAAPGRAALAHSGQRTPIDGAPVSGLDAGPAVGRTVTDGGTRSVLPYPSRAPVPASPGVGTGGAPTSGSGSTQDGGSSAVAPGATVAGSADIRRAFRAAEVETRRLVAESATFSPD